VRTYLYIAVICRLYSRFYERLTFMPTPIRYNCRLLWKPLHWTFFSKN